MLRRTLLATAIAIPALSACASMPAPSLAPLPRDPDSYSNPNEARVTHIALDLTADFDRKVMRGTATLHIRAAEGATRIVLDTQRLAIAAVRTNLGETEWSLGDEHERYGAPLSVAIGPGVETISVHYESGPDAASLQWLSPEQAGGSKPYLFSQGQSILNRTWIPLQDSPGVRVTYEARIVAPEGLTAVMSAEMLTPQGEPVESGRAFRFRMPQPIPGYLIALAVGELEHRAVDARTGVWGAPGLVERAAREFDDMPLMMRAAETLYGPYRWGRFDVLVLPPAFPYGGMENPRLTFATPTLLAGDKSLNNVIAHELAHSWSGNLVTNAVWADGWLNEGFTSYIEDRICELLYGEEYALQGRALAWAEIQSYLGREGAVTSLFAHNGASAVAYTKGALFLHTIERIIGRTRLDAYLRSYFDRHAFGPMTTAEFLQDFDAHVVRGDQALAARLRMREWAYEPNLPENAVEPQPQGFVEVAEFVAAFAHGAAPEAAPWGSWTTFQRQRYLQTAPRALPAERLAALEAAFGLDNTGNAEVLFDWLMLAVRNGYAPSSEAVRRFLTGMGRGKFVRPLFQAMMDQGAWGQALARDIYAQARPTYHPIVQRAADRIVNPA